MKSRPLDDDSTVLVFDKGDEIVATLTHYATAQGIGAAHFTAIGALSDVVLGYFDRGRKDYKKIPLREQVEVLSLVGDIALDGGKPKLHAHIVVGDAEGRARGGHLLEAHVWPTLELVLTPSRTPLRRRMDPETGLALIDPAA
jgi:predicted DNA-binding protein with PD1-like motif